MGAIFPDPILEQEMSAERWIPIPKKSARSAPMAPGAALPRPALEQMLGTPAKIFFKV